MSFQMNQPAFCTFFWGISTAVFALHSASHAAASLTVLHVLGALIAHQLDEIERSFFFTAVQLDAMDCELLLRTFATELIQC
jgi:hypothetical protein